MNIIVFGATGRVGGFVIGQALEAGHNATAFVRDAKRVKTSNEKMKIVTGDVLDRTAVRSALTPGFDAVVVCIGEGALKKSTIVTDGVRSIIAGMKETGIERYLGVSGTAEMPEQTFFGRMFNSLLKVTPVGHAIRDHDRAFQSIRNSGLKWVLAGCPYIRAGPRQGHYHTALAFPGGFKVIHPADVADFLVKELSEEKFTGKIVGLWY